MQNISGAGNLSQLRLFTERNCNDITLRAISKADLNPQHVKKKDYSKSTRSIPNKGKLAQNKIKGSSRLIPGRRAFSLPCPSHVSWAIPIYLSFGRLLNISSHQRNDNLHFVFKNSLLTSTPYNVSHRCNKQIIETQNKKCAANLLPKQEKLQVHSQ